MLSRLRHPVLRSAASSVTSPPADRDAGTEAPPPPAPDGDRPRGRRGVVPALGPLRPHHAALAAIVALSAVLNVRHLSQNAFANVYYSAGVRSELLSLHNLIFVSFDPSGLLMMDKTPLAIWLQDASAKLFGYSPLSLLLPEALAGVLAVAALYAIVARRLGALAALAGALTLTVFPSFVAVSRDNNPDALLILLLVLSCGVALRAIESGRLRHVIACAVLVGLAFNTKALAAYLVVPGIALAYLVCAPGSWPRRATHLLAGGLVLAVVSLAWISMVDLTPASQRPFVGDTTANSEYQLTLNYNGFGRVQGQVGGPGRIPRVPAPGSTSGTRRQGPPTPTARAIATGTSTAPSAARRRRPIVFAGRPGLLRLFGVALGDQAAWLVPFAALGALALALTVRGRRDPRLAFLLVLGSWFVIEVLVLDFSKGIVHPYYASALGPGTAALVGGGLTAMTELARRGGWRVGLAALAAALTVAVQLILMRREHYWVAYAPLLIAGSLGAVVVALARPRWAAPALAASLAFLLVAPMGYASTVWGGPVNGTFPAAGRNLRPGAGIDGLRLSNGGTDPALIAYVRGHHPGRRWEVLTVSTQVADPLIIHGVRAGSLAGYGGTDPVLDGPGLARLVRRGDARYIELGGVYANRGGNAATHAVVAACRRIPGPQWHGTRSANGLTLWDCAGRTAQLAAFR